MRVLITGGAGLVGSECSRLFAERGWNVITVDNYMRGKLFGEEVDTSITIKKLMKEYNIEHHEMDVRDEKIIELLKKSDVIIHTAAQPSHPKSIEIPLEDFQVNAWSTVFLLENVRKHNKDAIFVYCSTNKVYGDTPNYYSYKIVEKRYEPIDPRLWDGFDESLRIDQTFQKEC